MDIFTTYIYQPFFNILVGLYWVVGRIFAEPDMGIAVILFAVAVRIILLPIDMLGERSDEEKFQISEKIKKFKKDLSADPIRQREEIRNVMRQSPGAIVSELFSVIIQLLIILILYRIFTTGLEGADLHLIYPFMPQIREPINLMFLGKFDLSKTNSALNVIQSLMIALSEIIHLNFQAVKPSRRDFVSLVILFPLVCYGVFIFLPAGKKVFIVTSLAFGVIVMLVKQGLFIYYSLSHRGVNVPVLGETSLGAVDSQLQAQVLTPPSTQKTI
jgi:membrane protein insertase Oxa1/YidC/SpoIIIJ